MTAASRTRDLGDESPREVRCEDVSLVGINHLTYLDYRACHTVMQQGQSRRI